MTISQENTNEAMRIAALWAAIRSSGSGPIRVHMDKQNIDLGAQFVANLTQSNAADLAPKEVPQALGQAAITPVSGNDPNCPAGDNLVSIISDGDVVAQFCVNGNFFSK